MSYIKPVLHVLISGVLSAAEYNRRVASGNSLLKAAGMSALEVVALGGAKELADRLGVQYPWGPGTPRLEDFMLNVAGAVAGIVLVYITPKLYNAARSYARREEPVDISKH